MQTTLKLVKQAAHSYYVSLFYFTMQQLSKEMVVASLMPELTRYNYTQLFQDCKNAVITKETLKGSYEVLSKLRTVYDALCKRREMEDKPEREMIKARKEGYDTFMKPIKEILAAAEPILIQLNSEILKEEKEYLSLISDENAIKQKHITFVNETIKSITSETDNKRLVAIQRLVGLESTRKEYAGYSPIQSSCKLLLSLIEERKRILKENIKLEKEYDKAVAVNDMPKAAIIREEIDNNQRLIAENALEIANDAYKQVLEVQFVKPEFESMSIHAALHRWDYRVEDKAKMLKKHPEWFETIENDKAIGEFINSKRDSLNKDEEYNFDGLVVYYKPFFVKPSK